MKPRSKAGREPIKGRRRKTAEPKRRTTPKAEAPPHSSSAGAETEVARLSRELREALEQLTATSEVLRVISSSTGKPEQIFNVILENAVRLSKAKQGNLIFYDGEAFRTAALHHASAAYVEARRRTVWVVRELRPDIPLARLARTKDVVHIADLRAEQCYIDGDPAITPLIDLAGARTLLIVPMLKENELVGVFGVHRQEVHPFTDKQIALVQNFAAQAVIAIENARLFEAEQQRTRELTEALEQQTATSQVLQVISSSPGDLEPVFATMLENAVHICGATFGNIYRWDGKALHIAATHNTPPAFAEALRRSPYRPDPKNPIGHMVATKTLVHVRDVAAEEAYTDDPVAVSAVTLGGIRTLLGVPLLNKGEMIGAFFLSRQEVRPFTDKQIELVKNFAAQAVIAIENARLLNELRQRTTDLSERTADLTEALDQQTATSEVLQVISNSPGDLEPVFQAMLANAVQICDAKFGNLLLFEDGAFRTVALYGAPRQYLEERAREPVIQPKPGSDLDQLVKTKQAIHVPDIREKGRASGSAIVELAGARTILTVPMVKESDLIGAIGIYRQEVHPFTDKQIELVKNFAAQAVIAIENARLLNELRARTTDLTERTADLTEALEQQTATSEVLQVISSSPGDLQPVFAAMLEKAVRICDATFGDVYRPHGDGIQLVAMQNTPPAFAEALKQTPHFRPSSSVGLQMVATKSAVQVTDLAADPDYVERRSPFIVAAVELGGVRTVLAVPMLKENELIGAFLLNRQEVRPFTDKQIELVENFAAQAVIAIENARLLNELRQRTDDLSRRTADLTDALEQQTATSEVLRVISSSPGDLRPVFATMLENSVRICDAKFGGVYRCDDGTLRLVATHNLPLAYAEIRRDEPFRPKSDSPLGRMVATKSVVQYSDLASERYYMQRDPAAVAAVEVGGIRTVLAVPMLKENELIGILFLCRQDVRPFTDRQTALVQNFANQAVIAIENARLLNELRDTTYQVQAQSQQLAKLNQQLERRVADQVGEIERMSKLRRFLPPQVADLIVASGSEKQLESHRREITALFCDLRGFTGFTEAADAEDVMALLREYHAAIGEKIVQYSGTLERYAGDGVMVVFNDPVPVENPALQAVLMALEMREAIGALTETWRRWGHEIGFGIGIAHGFATLGTIGFEGRFDYAAIGTVSNVASRLCDEAKPGQILISPRVLTKVENAVKVEPVGEFELKGIRRPLAAYNVIAAAL